LCGSPTGPEPNRRSVYLLRKLVEAPPPERQEDLAAELRENEIWRQEPEIPKRAATFFAKEGSR
jgi:hypothetical protein